MLSSAGSNADSLAREHFAWFRNWVSSKFGRQAADDYAGEAFMLVLNKYDPTCGEFRNFASRALELSMKVLYAREHGRIGSKRREADNTRVQVDDTSVRAPESQEDSLLEELREFDTLAPKARAYGVLKTLGLFDDIDAAHVLERRSVRGVVSRA